MSLLTYHNPMKKLKILEKYHEHTKGQLISKCLFEKIVWTKIPPKNLIDSALQYFRAESIKFFGGILVQTIFSKRHFEINWPLQQHWPGLGRSGLCVVVVVVVVAATSTTTVGALCISPGQCPLWRDRSSAVLCRQVHTRPCLTHIYTRSLERKKVQPFWLYPSLIVKKLKIWFSQKGMVNFFLKFWI